MDQDYSEDQWLFLDQEGDRVRFFEVGQFFPAFVIAENVSLFVYVCRKVWKKRKKTPQGKRTFDIPYLVSYLLAPIKAVFVSKRDDITVLERVAAKHGVEIYQAGSFWALVNPDLGVNSKYQRSYDILRALEDPDRKLCNIDLFERWTHFVSCRLDGWGK